MKRKLLMAIAVGAFVAPALPVAALENIRGPLSPSGGESENIGDESISSANADAGEFVVSAAPGQFLFVPDFTGLDAMSSDEGTRGPLSPAGSSGGISGGG